MTRDTQIIHDDRDPLSDAEVYAALWAAAPFPRLPHDAPNELKKLTIDIDDPKRVYAIHRASRRHHFHILVERYILQIRYGCQSKSCNTTTCFSCRKRLAGGAPVRRYNATSARTLAVYMASQDNPELGLCHNPSAGRPIPQTNKPANRLPPTRSRSERSPVKDAKMTSSAPIDSSSRERRRAEILWREADGNETPSTETGGVCSQSDTAVQGDEIETRKEPAGRPLEEPTTTDHRSFVQNIFGTVAFKMLEWLTPRNLELLTRVGNEDPTAAEATPTDDPLLTPQNSGEDIFVKECEKKFVPSSSESKAKPHPGDQDSTLDKPATGSSRRPSASKREPIVTRDAKGDESSDLKFHNVPKATRPPSPNLRRRPESIESPRGILNIPTSPRIKDNMPDIVPVTMGFQPSKPQRKLSRQTLTKSPQMRAAEIEPNLVEVEPIQIQTAGLEPDSPKVDPTQGPDQQATKDELQNNVEHSPQKSESPRSESTKDVLLPQSLSYLSIEAVDLVCDILQSDGTCETHVLQPRSVNDCQRRSRDKSRFLRRRKHPGNPSSSKKWRLFIEQSFFDVLGKPESLLRSFSNEESRLFDTQTIWYLMLRMTRVAPSLVFDSLWNVAGSLFRPPEKLEVIYDWAKESRNKETLSSKALSTLDAAQVINICLHALVAAAPLLTDARQLANMSRIRSYGLAMLGRESSALESATLCLHYEDAFTNELALRLARRIFAAIPIRQRFAGLLDFQKDIRKNEKLEPDILETILSTLKFLDLGTPPTLNFPDHERELHEKRVPTLILDWARTVMLQDWAGTAEVPRDGPFGGSLATVAAIYKNRKSLLLGDIHFRTEYFAERLDSVGMPLEWISFEPNKRTVHLLDYPYLFNPSTLVTYFRAINYSRMNQSYEAAKATDMLVHSTAAPKSLITDEIQRRKLYDRLRTATSSFMVLEIRRHNVLVDTFNSIWRREERELMRPLKIRLGEEGGEEGLDSGGVQQEFFRLAIAEALDPDYGTFTIDTRTKMTWFQPGSPEPLWKFELIGMIISIAVYNGLTLPVTFPKALYRKLLDEEVTELHHIADGWPDLANGLTTLLEWDEKDGLVEEIFARTYEFSVEQFGQPVSREMGASSHWPQFSDLQTSSNPTDAPLVTNENRNSYVSDYIQWLTDVSIRPQFEAFKAGFFACIDRRSITLFDPETLQSVVEGIQEIDISEMRRATRYIGWEASHRTVRDFWSIVRRYDMDQKRKLLEFVTASDRVPVGGMRNLQFTLQRNGIDDGHLPSSYTCYGILLLPEYSSKDVLREKLAMALENSKGFGFA